MALATDPDEGLWESLFNEVDGFDPAQSNALVKLAAKAPYAHTSFAREAQSAGKSIEDHLADKYQDLAGFLDSWRSRLQPHLKLQQTIRAFRESRALPEPPGILVRYQPGLDNGL